MKSQKPQGYWNKERIQEVALLCSSRSEFQKNYGSARTIAIKNGWYDEVTSHLTRKTRKAWNLEGCKQEALKYQTRKAFQVGASGAYCRARENGWLDQICGHMESLCVPKGYWTKERLIEEANKFDTKKAFREGNCAAYSAAFKSGLLNEICGHMKALVKPKGYWTFENCRIEASKYSTKNELHDLGGACFAIASKNGWLDEICAHMPEVQKPNGYWTKERCKEAAKQCDTKREFSERFPSAYAKSASKGWHDDVCDHMKPVEYGYYHCLYAIVNQRKKSVYVGVTRDAFDKRMRHHQSDQNGTRSKALTSLDDTEYVQLTDYIYQANEVGDVERLSAQRYANMGYTVFKQSRFFWWCRRIESEVDKRASSRGSAKIQYAR